MPHYRGNLLTSPCLQGMTRASNQESDHMSWVQQLHCRVEPLSNQVAELEKALNTAKSDVVLQVEKFMELAQHIVACAPQGCAASSATLQAKVCLLIPCCIKASSPGFTQLHNVQEVLSQLCLHWALILRGSAILLSSDTDSMMVCRALHEVHLICYLFRRPLHIGMPAIVSRRSSYR